MPSRRARNSGWWGRDLACRCERKGFLFRCEYGIGKSYPSPAGGPQGEGGRERKRAAGWGHGERDRAQASPDDDATRGEAVGPLTVVATTRIPFSPPSATR